MSKIKKWFIGKYVEIMFWWHRRNLERELDKELSFIGKTSLNIYQDDTQRKYAEGMSVVKNKVNTLANRGTKEDYHKVLKEVKELIALAREETSAQQAVRKALTGMASLPETSKKKMIEQRIQHYGEFQAYNEERALIKQVKQARKEGNIKLAEELETQWREKYGKARNPRGR